LDFDNDGITDYLDKWPGTSAGSEVDESGCTKIEPEKKPEANKLNSPFYYYDSSHETEIRTGIRTAGNQYIVLISS